MLGEGHLQEDAQKKPLCSNDLPLVTIKVRRRIRRRKRMKVDVRDTLANDANLSSDAWDEPLNKTKKVYHLMNSSIQNKEIQPNEPRVPDEVESKRSICLPPALIAANPCLSKAQTGSLVVVVSNENDVTNVQVLRRKNEE